MSQYKWVSGKFEFTGGGELDMEVCSGLITLDTSIGG